jgi:single-strand DNA-binding protein
MSGSISVVVCGHLGKEARALPGEQGGAGFSVATEAYLGKDNKVTTWVDVALWGKRGESLRQYLVKGSFVIVRGTAWLEESNGKTYMKVRADDVQLGPRADKSASGGKGQSNGSAANASDFEPPF